MEPKYVEHGEVHTIKYRRTNDTMACVEMMIGIPWEVEDFVIDDNGSEVYEDLELESVKEIETWLEKHGYTLISIQLIETEGTPFTVDDLKY